MSRQLRSIPASAGQPVAGLTSDMRLFTGSIPASAGQPQSTGSYNETITWVYPRECGATHRLSYIRAIDNGLSPRVRGNHTNATAAYTAISSVYPRECGATARGGPLLRESVSRGLSPRVRGQRATHGCEQRHVACGLSHASASQPLHQAGSIVLFAVHPRESGATGESNCTVSSRVRSIPASAGQRRCRLLDRDGVYPRDVRGNHLAIPSRVSRMPRRCGSIVRRVKPAPGNLQFPAGPLRHRQLSRSIPASAGRP